MILSLSQTMMKMMEDKVECPICQKKFNISEIVEHSQHCGLSPSPPRRPSPPRKPSPTRRPSPPRQEERICPFCQRSDFYSDQAYISHVTDCQTRGGGDYRRRPSPPRRASPLPQKEDRTCPFCGRRDFSDEPDYLQHLSLCQDSMDDQPQQHQQHQPHQDDDPNELRECPFCHQFKSSVPAALQMHMQSCTGETGGAFSRLKKFFSRG